MQRPGLEAEEITRVLNLEGIPCLLECQGMKSLRPIHHEPGEPLAISLPVSVFVPAALVSEAKKILQSLQRQDVVGDQWAAPSDLAVPTPLPGGLEGGGVDQRLDPNHMEHGSPSPEGTSLRFVIALVIAGLAIFWTIGD